MHCTRLIFMAKKGSQRHNFKVKFKYMMVFLDFSKLLLDGNSHPKVEKTFFQPGNCFSKIYQRIHIDQIG